MPRGSPYEFTADAVLISSGNPVVIYGVSVDSAATGAIINFRHGTAVTSTIYFDVRGTASQVNLAANIPAEGLHFPNGCFVDVDANTNRVIVWAEAIRIT